jgi:hypothetical protein
MIGAFCKFAPAGLTRVSVATIGGSLESLVLGMRTILRNRAREVEAIRMICCQQ